MITAIGLAGDKTFAHFVGLAREFGREVQTIDLGEFVDGAWCCELDRGESLLRLESAGRRELLRADYAYYGRLIDLSPALAAENSLGWRQLLLAISSHLECVTGPVINRPGAHTHNAAKPLHEVWLAHIGFRVPEALTSSDPKEITNFISEHGECIVKTLSGVRSTAQAVTCESFRNFTPSQGPVHLQRRVRGDDVRAHIVDHRVHAERVRSDGVDYRDRAVESSHECFDLTRPLTDLLVQATAELGLVFAGWDFKVDGDDYWCLEANPMPGYDGYDRRAQGAITRSLLDHLDHGSRFR